MRRKGSWIVALVLTLVLALLPGKHVAWAATVTVNSTTDVSDGDTSSIANLIANPGADDVISLREAIEAANNTPGSDTIAFNIPDCGGVCTIQPLSALPTLSGGSTTIDGYSQPGAAVAADETAATLLIEINGASAGTCHGLHVTSAGNKIKGLVINRFTGYWYGIFIDGSGATGNIVSGNYIGTDASGTVDLGNPSTGIYIGNDASNNIIGGDTAAERNVTSGNGGYGVRIEGSGTTGNIVSGNYIGVDASGTVALGNGGGVLIDHGAHDNTVGGDTAGERNVISGNGGYGVWIHGSGYSGTTGNTVSGNYIGVDASGTAALGNDHNGVAIGGGAHGNTIGGSTANERNVISGNGDDGICIYGSSDASSTSNIVSGNYIGTDASGTAALGNASSGVHILGTVDKGPTTTIGGDTAGERNVISGNFRCGVYIYGSNAMSNTVSGNYIGTDASGTVGLGNRWSGVTIRKVAKYNTIGGATVDERNIISGNDHDGVSSDGGATRNTVSGNYIGTDVSGTLALGNGWNGVSMDSLTSDTHDNTVGPGNVIAHNVLDGVQVRDSSSTGNIITQNSIYANDEMGIDLTGAANGDITAPVIVTTTNAGPVDIVGTACPGCTVEVFENGNADGEGETYVGDATANASGAFSVTVSALGKPYLTATATDAVSGTSEFSVVFSTTEETYVYLPIVLNNH